MRISALALLVILGGCAATGPTSDAIGVRPANWEQATKLAAKTAYVDPYSVRDAMISEPVPASMVFDGQTPIPHSGWMVCVRANAKNRFGGYTGLQVTGFLFQGGQIVTMISEPEYAVAHHCGEIFRPFTIPA